MPRTHVRTSALLALLIVLDLALAERWAREKACAADGRPAAKVVLELKGYLVPGRSVEVCSEVPGRVVEVDCSEGQLVRCGQLLARLDDRNSGLGLQRAQLLLQKAKAALAGLMVRQLSEPVEMHNSRVLAARADVRIAEVDLGLAEHRVRQTEIVAPFEGTVMARKVDVGSVVDPRGLKVPAAICALADLSQMEVEVRVPEADLGKIAVAQPCAVRLDAFPRQSYAAMVARIVPIADRATGTVNVRVRLVPRQGNERNGDLRPEMAATVSFLEGNSQKLR